MKAIRAALVLAVTSRAGVVNGAAPYKTIGLAKSSGLRADSDLGMKLLSHARRIEEGNNHGDGGEQQQEQADITWVANFSIKFQGCHNVQQVH